MQQVCRLTLSVNVISNLSFQVEEKRTPLQLSMDELAKKLSILSFGIIGMICLIGVLQQRSWLDMFTIGGMSVSTVKKRLNQFSFSLPGGCCHP